MFEMTLNNTATRVEDSKKEVLTTFDVAPTDGLQILRERANEVQEYCHDHILKDVSLKNMALSFKDCFESSFVDDSKEVQTHKFSDFSFGQLCTKLGVPPKYMLKCATSGYPELAIDNLNTWVDDYGKDLLFRVYKDKIRGVLSNRYSIFDTPDIIDIVDDATKGLNLYVKSYFLNEERFHARIVQQEKMKINGEDLFAGIQIDSSDVGRSTLMVNFFIFKQICTNGLCISKGKANLFTQKHISICSDDFREELKSSLKCLPQLIEEYSYVIQRSAMQYSILGSKYSATQEDRDRLLENLVQKLKSRTKLSDEGVSKVINLAENKYGLSDWGVINSITEVAQDYTLERRIELEKIAGSMLRAI